MSSGPCETATLIAVIDDEPMIGDVIRRSLRSQATVTYYQTCEDVLEALRGDIRFQLILCDLLMPDCTGRQIYDAVLERWPDQASRFVFMTGGSQNGPIKELIGDLHNEILPKPFSLEDLRALATRYGSENVESGS